MVNRTILELICGLIGAGIGTFMTRLTMKKDMETELQKAILEKQNELNELYETNYKPKKEPIKDSILASPYKKPEEILAQNPRQTEDGLRWVDDSEVTQYNQYYDPDKVPSDGVEWEYYEEYNSLGEGKEDTGFPRIITREQFYTDNGYAKIKLNFYEEDGVFAHRGDNSNSGIPEEYFGPQNLSEFGNYKYDDGETDEWTLYFRSDIDKTDYDVYYDPYESYESVLEREGVIHSGD